MEKKKCKTEVYSRVTGYYSPTSQWNKGKNEERKDRKKFDKEYLYWSSAWIIDENELDCMQEGIGWIQQNRRDDEKETSEG